MNLHPSAKPLRWVLFALLLGLLPTTGIASPALSAERIYAAYGALERSIAVDALETYAKTGKLDDDLAIYIQKLNSQQQAQLRRVLMTRIDLSPVAISQFLYTPIGETLLERLGEVIQTEARQPGFYAIRGALILAAAEPQGLTLLNVLRKFPTGSIRIDLLRSLQLSDQLQRIVNRTKQALAAVSEESTQEVATQNGQVNFSQLPDLRRRSRFSWNKQTLKLNDRRRDRTFFADLYLPVTSRPSPVIVISHGLGSDRTSFVYLATQLASYGFAVAVPEHPGSDANQVRALLEGRANEVAEPNEFINRPLDVKYLLDELERLDKSNPNIQLNMQQVGVIGQSFGGYTALALAGATINFQQLQKDCQATANTWNVSLLLQCRSQELPATQYNLHDQRIKAAIAINPITSSVFGQAGLSQIQIPVMLVGCGDDTVAPALSEQILPFTWLTTKEKYLVTIPRGTHFSIIGETNPATDPVELPAEVIGPQPALARRYMQALSVAFLETYVVGTPGYRPYLSASYAQTISQAPLDLNLVQSISLPQQAEASTDSIPAALSPGR